MNKQIIASFVLGLTMCATGSLSAQEVPTGGTSNAQVEKTIPGPVVDKVMSINKSQAIDSIDGKYSLSTKTILADETTRRLYEKFKNRPKLIAKSPSVGAKILKEYSELESQSSQIVGDKGLILPRYYKKMDPEEFIANVEYLRIDKAGNKILVYSKKKGKISEFAIEKGYATTCEIGSSTKYIFCRLTPSKDWEEGARKLKIFDQSGNILKDILVNEGDKYYMSSTGRYVVYSASKFINSRIVSSYRYIDLETNKEYSIELLKDVPPLDYDIQMCDNGSFSFSSYSSSLQPDKFVAINNFGKVVDTVDLAYLKNIPLPDRKRYHTSFDCSKTIRYGTNKGSEYIKNVDTKKTIEIPKVIDPNISDTGTSLSNDARQLAITYHLKGGGQSDVYTYDLQTGSITKKKYNNGNVKAYFQGVDLIIDDGSEIQTWTLK